MNRLVFKLFARDWRGGELTLLSISLIIAISTMTSITLFTDRIKHSIVDKASEVLAADAQIRGSSAPEQSWLDHARNTGLATAMATSMSVMAFSGDNMKLSAVKAVSSEYPLKGVLEISDVPFGEGREVRSGPSIGEVWLSSGLFSSLNITVGDSIDIGERSLLVSAALITEPDINMGAIFSGSRILMNLFDLESTGSVRPGSRIRYHWMLSGPTEKIGNFKEWVEPKLDAHHWWVSAENSSGNIANTLERAQSFLLLAGCLSVILAGIAVALAAKRYAFKQGKSIALLKTLGATPKKITQMYIMYLLLLGIITSFIGIIVGWGLHWCILYVIRDLLSTDLQPPSLKAYWGGATTGFIALLVFAGPPLLALRRVPPVTVIRDALTQSVFTIAINSLIGVIAIVFLVYWYSQSLMITSLLLITFLACAVGVGSLAWLLVYTAKVVGKGASGNWRLGLANLYRHRHYNIVQIMIFTILLSVMFVIFLVRTSLITHWQSSKPINAPNYFAYNIFSNDKEKISKFLDKNGIQSQPFYPIVQGRIASVNGKEFQWTAEDKQQQNRYVRELGLTWSDSIGESSSLIAGRWWPELQEASDLPNQYVSIEKSFAEGMKLKIGDTLTMSISGVEFDTEVASIRSVEWTSVNPNFFMVFRHPILGGDTANWVTSFHIPAGSIDVINGLAREYPTITLLAVDQIIMQIDGIIRQITMAVEFILGLVLVAGILVLVTGIQATLDERLKESAILRTLGANRRLVQQSLLIEFCGLGLVAGILATFVAEFCLALLQLKLFSTSFQLNLLLIPIGPLIGICLIGSIGWFSTRKVTQTPPLLILKGLNSRT